jgi:hypothetical protein
LGLVPFGVALLLDTCGVLLVGRAAGIELRAGPTLAVRVISEAFHFGAPGGVVASEAAALALLSRRCGLVIHEGIVVLAGRKLFVMRAHAVYLALGACLGGAALATIGASMHMRARLPWLALGAAAVPLAMSVALGLAMSSPTKTIAQARPYVLRLERSLHVTVPATLAFLAAWLVEAAETAVILRVVGTPLSMPAVLAVESVLSLARSAVAFVPGGLGVQDVGYATALGALGTSQEHAAAFVLLKRAKEVIWVAAGFAFHLAASTRLNPPPLPNKTSVVDPA